MNVPWRGTSSAFLLLTFNIGFVLCQNVGQECSFSVAPQGEAYNEYNPDIANLQPPKNKIRFYPAIRSPTFGAIEDCQKPPIQENIHPTLNLQGLSPPDPHLNFSPENKQSRSDLLYSTASCNGQGLAHPCSESLLNPCPCPEPPITPYAPQNPAPFEASPQEQFQLQPISHGIPRGRVSPLSFAYPDRSAETLNDVKCPHQTPSFSSANALKSLSVPMLRNFFTPLVPYPHSRLPLPCADVQPLPFHQGTSVPEETFNNQGHLASPVDVLPLQPSRETCTRKDNPTVNYSPLNTDPELTLPSPPVNCLPQSPAIELRDTFPQSQPCSTIPPGPSSIDPFQDLSSLSPCDQCKVTRSLCSCPVSSCQSCQPACHCSVCDDEPSLFQIDTCLQVPHSIPSCVCNENCQPHRPYCDYCPSLSLNSGCCSCTNNDFFIPQSSCVTQTCGTANNCFGSSHPQLLSCDCSPPCSTCALPSSVSLPCCESPCHSPEPINVQINVPPPIIPAPSITIINTAPEPAQTDSGYFDMSPMIIDRRRRKSKSWLPLLLVWLFSCDGFGGFGGCGGGCDSGSMPVLFPIPIPT